MPSSCLQISLVCTPQPPPPPLCQFPYLAVANADLTDAKIKI
jgi:hypothetical protein